MLRRVAAHRVKTRDEELRMCIVEINDGIVTDYYTFSEEQPFTEWIGGTIDIITDETGARFAVWQGERLF